MEEFIKSVLMVGAGGFVGSALRFVVTLLSKEIFHTAFPIGTFIVNIVGCLLIGVVFGLAEKTNLLSNVQILLLATGFCGGFTTFSAFANEAFVLGAEGNWLLNGVYVVASVVIGIASVWIGRNIVPN